MLQKHWMTDKSDDITLLVLRSWHLCIPLISEELREDLVNVVHVGMKQLNS